MGFYSFNDISSMSSEALEDFDGNYVLRFNNLISERLKIQGAFDDNIWKITDLNLANTHNFKFKFSELIKKITNTESIISSLKSWCIAHLEYNYEVGFTAKKISYVIDAIEKSNCFDINLLETFNEHYFNRKYNKNTINSKAAVLLDFLEYAQFIIDDEFYEFIVKIYNSTLSRQNIIREIPPSRDILKFSLIVENYFNGDISLKSYLKYYPVHLWWNLTNIIPLRIREFCMIRDNALKPSKDGFTLELPRLKGRQNRDIKYDHILISDKLAYSIKNYQEKTKMFGTSETLLNYSATCFGFIKRDKFINRFLYNDFVNILDDFYKEIVQGHYGFVLLEHTSNGLVKTDEKYITRKIRPNDTRHFAFINLMLQGYHPSIIARLGGHSSIYSQYTYHNHIEYWVDSDLVNLLMSQQNSLSDLSNHFFQEVFFKQKIHNPILEEDIVKIPLKMGFCTDPQQQCKVDEHYLCEHWRISIEDFEEHFDELKKLISNQESILKTLVKNLLSLLEVAIKNNKNITYSEQNSKFNYLLVENANEVKNSLYQLFQLKEKVVPYEKQR